MTLSQLWPRAIPFRDLAVRIAGALYDEPVDSARFTADSDGLALSFLECYCRGVMRLSLSEPAYAACSGEKPKGSPISRFQATSSQIVTNALNESVALTDLSRRVLVLADGSRSGDEILTELCNQVERGELMLQAENRPIIHGELARPALSESLERSLKKLAEDALLLG